MNIHLRPSQAEILRYRRGKMGISAVPGSGKTYTLSRLAAQIISQHILDDDQEVLIVTLVNSAVDNFYQQVSTFVKQSGLLPNTGYQVRTLHGLANDILRERPSLVGLGEDFQIIDERESLSILNQAAQVWIKSHPAALRAFLSEEIENEKFAQLMHKDIPELASTTAQAFVKYAKDLNLTPEKIRQRLEEIPLPMPLAEMGCQIYTDYQQALAYRGAVDFDDLIRLSYQALENESDFLERLRRRWPYILEDEAQDSSRLQEEILKLLAGENGNWVRVGDPNQAIYETFTTASPRFLTEFIRRRDVQSVELPGSGRSTPSIINLANYLVQWSQESHPLPEARNSLVGPPFIQAVEIDDPNPNPPDDPHQLHLVLEKYTSDKEIQIVAESIRRWLPNHPGWTLAVLVPTQDRAISLVETLRQFKIPFEDSLLKSSSQTRQTARRLQTILEYLAYPGQSTRLSEAYLAWFGDEMPQETKPAWLQTAAALVRQCRDVENYLSPGLAGNWLESLPQIENHQEIYSSLSQFRQLMQRWSQAVQLPIDQLVLSLSQDLFQNSGDLALSHKLALLLEQAAGLHPEWQLPDMVKELKMIAQNERRFFGFSTEDTGFDPSKYTDMVVVSTYHKAKGLEWDRVYLMSVNNYDFPSGLENDRFRSEKWYLRDQLNLVAETLAQLEAALNVSEFSWYEEGQPSLKSREDYVRERLRLLYVGITRAKRELVITWNTGHYGDLRPAAPLVALASYWKSHLAQEETGENP